MSNIPVVCYLFTSYDHVNSLMNFINNYSKFNAGINHKLIICYKLIEKTKLEPLRNLFLNITHEEFIDPETKNDYDFGSYNRVAAKFQDNDILFLNSHSYPISDNWLKKLMLFKDEDTVIGSSASYESLADSIILKKIYKYFSYIFKKVRFNKNFKNFPNPHLRTTGFLIKGKSYCEFMFNRSIKNKEDAWKIESGKNSLTNFFKKKNFKFFVVNSENKKFTEENWMLSETYCYLNQSKSIISDKQTRKYLSLSTEEKKIAQNKVWGS